MEIRVVKISNGYLIYSDMAEKPMYQKVNLDVEVYIKALVREWLTKEIQKDND